jgi:hypothetical protein
MEPDGEDARVFFLGREYLITKGGVRPADECPADANSLSVLIYYVVSEGAAEPAGDFVQLNRLTGMISGRNELTRDFIGAPLIRKFGEDPGKLGEAIESIGGTKLPEDSPGKHAWQLRPLPKILAQIVFYEADDEFPADVQIFYDRTAPSYLEFECLAFMTGCMVKAIAGGVA